MARIFHLADPQRWAQARKQGEYRQSTREQALAEAGFIHACFPHQLPGVRQRFYSDVPTPLTVLEIDPERLTAPLLVEDGDRGTGEAFPHIFGPVNTQAVVSTRALQPPHDRSSVAFDVRRLIGRPRDVVWERLTDWSSATRWLPGVAQLHGDGPATEGTRLRFTGDMGSAESVVTCVWPQSMLTLTSARGPVRADYSYVLTDVSGGTLLRLLADVTTSLSPADADQLRRHIADADMGQLERFAELVEA